MKKQIITEDFESIQFNQEEANAFFSDLLEQVFSNGMIEELEKFYAPDVIGHYYGELINLNDIQNRILALKNETKNCCLKVQTLSIIDSSYIALISNQSWEDKRNNSFHDSIVFALYRIKNKKIAELWIFLESPTLAYKEINSNFSKNMRLFELHCKSKRTFLNVLILF